jgi:hypothetical protein
VSSFGLKYMAVVQHFSRRQKLVIVEFIVECDAHPVPIGQRIENW